MGTIVTQQTTRHEVAVDAATPAPLARVEHVTRVIGGRAQRTTILDDVTFDVPAASLFAINDPSGSGKSTVLNMLTGLDRPTSGRVVFGGQELRARGENALAKWRGHHVGIIFQFFQLIPTLTAEENVLLALQLGGGGGIARGKWRERAHECLALADVADYSRRLPGALSGGQQQRVAIARALANDPPVLVADEPGTVVISQQMQQQAHLALGDTLTVSSTTTSASWRVIGVVHDLNGGLGTIGSAFTTIGTLHAFAGLPADEAGSFMLQAADRSPAAVNRMATALDDTLSRAGLNPVVSTAQQQIARNQSEFNILYVLLYAVAVIVALVGVLGLFNTLTTSVLERRREIGIWRSLGATGWRVATVFWVEGLSLAGVAWLVAVALGIPAAYGFIVLIGNVLIQMPFAFDPSALALMLAFTFVLATMASVIPAASASRVRVADTLRYE